MNFQRKKTQPPTTTTTHTHTHYSYSLSVSSDPLFRTRTAMAASLCVSFLFCFFFSYLSARCFAAFIFVAFILLLCAPFRFVFTKIALATLFGGCTNFFTLEWQPNTHEIALKSGRTRAFLDS